MQVTVKTALESPGVDAVQESFDPMITSYFSLNPNDIEPGDKPKLKDIENYLKEQGGEDLLKRMEILRDVRSRVGTPMLGQTQIDLIHRHMMLTRAIKDNEAQLKEIER